MPKVTVLVAAYNSERYLEELLQSLLRQTHGHLEILIRDDGSSDRTPALIEDYARRDERIRPVVSVTSRRGAKENFFALLSLAPDGYTMFSDADDVWNADKVEKTLALMRETEAGRADLPVLVHTDLAVTDEALRPVSPSLFRYEKLSPERSGFKQLLVQNPVTGCTVMVNQALRDYVQKTPEDAVMHDWWLALVASAFGRVSALRESTMLYRQHGGNQVGAYDAGDLSASLQKLRDRAKIRGIYSAMYRQAAAFADTYREMLSRENLLAAEGYAGMAELSRFGKILRIIRRGYYKNTFLRNLGQFLVI